MHTDVLEVDTTSRRIVDLTDAVRRFLLLLWEWPVQRVRPARNGRGVAIIETGAGSDDDLIDTLERLFAAR